jgi:hypothetical protein
MAQTALLLALAAPGFALVQPLLPRGPALALTAGSLVCVAILSRIPLRQHPWIGSQWLLERVRRPWRHQAPRAEAVLASLTLEPESPFAGRPLADLGLAVQDAGGAEVVAIQRGGRWLPPSDAMRLQAGDRIALNGTPAALEVAKDVPGRKNPPDPGKPPRESGGAT